MALEILGDTLRIVVAAGLMIAGLLAISIWIRNKTIRITYLRAVVQVTSLVAVFSSLLLLAEWPSLVLAAIIFATIFAGRFFCGWICPFGLYMDFITLVRKSVKIGCRNLSERVNRSLHRLRYILVAAVLALPFFFGNPLDPETWRSFLFFESSFKPLIIFFLGPLEPLLIPWAGAVGFGGHSLSYPYIRGIIDYFPESIMLISVFLFIALTVATSFIARRFWCRFCPTGASLAVVNRFKGFKWAPMLHIDKDEEKCTKCGVCKRVCSVQVNDVYEQKGGKIRTSQCMLCLRCVEMCPYEDVLKVKFANKTLFKSRNWLEPSTSE